MVRGKRPVISLLLIVVVVAAVNTVSAREVIVFGEDCSQKERQALLSRFGFDEVSPQELGDVTVLTVSNREERQYLPEVSDSLIGTRAISSAYVKTVGKGSGIEVATHNITWVTPTMYALALSTAGVQDAEVIAAAPAEVSGTAALTGIMKAFEAATGKTLKPRAKSVGQKELLRTSQLGRDLEDPDQAAALVWEIKKRVLSRKSTSPEVIDRVIQAVARDNRIDLTPAQVEDLRELMLEIRSLNINLEDLSGQLTAAKGKLDELLEETGESRSILQRLIEWLASLLARLFGAIGYALERLRG